jgi:hypothetical protein
MEKYITIPTPTANEPGYLVKVSGVLGVKMNSSGNVEITPVPKGNTIAVNLSRTADFSGTTTTFNTNSLLIDSAATFITDGIKPGYTVVVDGSGFAQVLSVDSETQLTLDVPKVFGVAAQPYVIWVDYSAPAKHIQNAMLEALQSKWIDPIYEISDFPFTITSITR